MYSLVVKVIFIISKRIVQLDRAGFKTDKAKSEHKNRKAVSKAAAALIFNKNKRNRKDVEEDKSSRHLYKWKRHRLVEPNVW